MKVGEIFDGLLTNLKVDNKETIATRRDEIAKALNNEFRGLQGSTNNQLMVGSYGRSTAIRGVSDLDMLYILPSSIRDSHKGDDGPTKVLSRTRAAIKSRYPSTDVKVDRLVVVAQFQNFKFEVQPVFENDDKSFSYPDTSSKTWKVTKPREEIDAIRTYDDLTSGNLRNLCKMARAWKNEHGVVMGGLLIDTLVYNFFQKATAYDSATTASYDVMVRDYFKFLSEEDDHEHYAALGSGQRVKVKKKFQRKAKAAYELCLAAIDAEGKPKNKQWKEIFGQAVPNEVAAMAASSAHPFDDTEEFIENSYPVDVRFAVSIDCTVTQNGFRSHRLREMLTRRLPLLPQKNLDFTITQCDVPEPYMVKWKVLNRGDEAERRNMVRGQIIDPNKGNGHHEMTSFRGAHYVECYIVKDDVVAARDRIKVPITTQ